MIFIQLTLTDQPLHFNTPVWIEKIKRQYPSAEVLELDNHSDAYTFQQTLKWIIEKKEPPVIYIKNTSADCSTGTILRFMQELLSKCPPMLIFSEGEHRMLEKVLRISANYSVVKSEEEAMDILSSKF